MRIVLALAVALLLLPGCRRGGGDNPGGYSDSYWQDRRQKSDLAHRPRKGPSHMIGIAFLAVAPRRRRAAS